MKKAIFFDLDGTLWNALSQITISWNLTMEKYHYAYRFNLETVKSIMGLTPEETCRLLFNDKNLKDGLEIFHLLVKEEINYLSKHPGIIYENEDNVLSVLSAKYDLYVVSNSDKGYIENYLSTCNKEKYFKGHICAGDLGLAKWQNILYLKKKEKIDEVIYVGDTLKDKIESEKAHVKFIHAAYGFGNINDDSLKINNLNELIFKVEEAFAENVQKKQLKC